MLYEMKSLVYNRKQTQTVKILESIFQSEFVIKTWKLLRLCAKNKFERLKILSSFLKVFYLNKLLNKLISFVETQIIKKLHKQKIYIK